MNRRKLHIALAFVLLVGVAGVPAVASALLDPDPDQAEQWLIYELNRARWNPWGYAEDHGVVPAQTNGPLLPRPPLAVDTDLAQSSGYKAQQTVDYPSLFNAGTHCTTAPGPRPCPDGLARYFGYPLPGTNDAVNTIESYWSSNGLGATPPDVSGFLASPQHIDVMFKWEDRREVGVGWADGCAVTPSVCADKGGLSYLFFHLGYRSAPRLFITGVVYDDQNGNRRMDASEPGLSGVTVSRSGGVSTTTNGGGGYSLLVGPGAYTVTASGAGVPSRSATVRVIDHNVGVDFEKDTAPVVREYPSRLAGADRFATAAEVSRFSHPSGADVVYIAVGTNYPDALAAGPAAAIEDAPILLVNATGVPAVTEAELNRLSPNQIVVLGGPAAISDGVVAYLDARFPTVVRRFGPTRYETAAAITAAAFPGAVNKVYIATGDDFPDALIAGPAAVHDGAALLLVHPGSIPAAVAAELRRLDPNQIVVVGSNSAVSNSVLDQLKGYAPTIRIAGNDRYALSAAVAAAVFPTSKTAYIATGPNYPDALAAGPATAMAPGPILLVGSSIPGSVSTELIRTSRQTIIVLGGPAAVSDTILYQLVVDYLPD